MALQNTCRRASCLAKPSSPPQELGSGGATSHSAFFGWVNRVCFCDKQGFPDGIFTSHTCNCPHLPGHPLPSLYGLHSRWPPLIIDIVENASDFKSRWRFSGAEGTIATSSATGAWGRSFAIIDTHRRGCHRRPPLDVTLPHRLHKGRTGRPSSPHHGRYLTPGQGIIPLKPSHRRRAMFWAQPQRFVGIPKALAECRHSPLLVVVVLLLVGTGPCPCMHQNPHSHIVLDHAWHIVGNVSVELQLQPVTQGHRLLGFRLGWIDDGLHLPHFDDWNGLASKLPVNPTPQGVTGVHGRIPFHVVSGSKVPGELWKGSFRQRLIDIALLTSHLGRLLDRHQTSFIGRLETGLSHPIVLQGSNCLAKLCYWLLPTRTIHHIDIVLQGLHSMLGQELRAPGFLDVGGFKAWAQTSIGLENVDASSRHVGPKPCKGGGHDHTLTLPIQCRPPMSVTEHELARLLPTWKKSQTPGKTKHACRQNYIFTTPTRPTPTKAAIIYRFSIHHRIINATTSNAPLGPRRWLWGVWPDIAGKSRPSKLRQSLLQHAPGLVQMENLCTKVLVVLREARPSRRYGAFSPVAATSCCRWRILPALHQPALQPPPKHLKLKKTSHPLRRQMTWSPPFQAPLEPSTPMRNLGPHGEVEAPEADHLPQALAPPTPQRAPRTSAAWSPGPWCKVPATSMRPPGESLSQTRPTQVPSDDTAWRNAAW